MKIHDLEVFCTVAEEESFVKAAHRLYISQSAVTQHIKKIETELGFPLLIRNKHFVKMTAQGEIFHRAARDILLRYQQMLDDCARESGAEHTLRLSYVGPSGAPYLTDLLKEKKVDLVSYHESIDTTTANGRLMLTMIAAINEFERQNILDRQAEGIAEAKKRGVYKGRKKISIPNIGTHYERYMRREITKPKLAKELGITRVTLDRLFKEYLEKQKEKGLINTGTPMEGQQTIKESENKENE